MQIILRTSVCLCSINYQLPASITSVSMNTLYVSITITQDHNKLMIMVLCTHCVYLLLPQSCILTLRCRLNDVCNCFILNVSINTSSTVFRKNASVWWCWGGYGQENMKPGDEAKRKYEALAY